MGPDDPIRLYPHELPDLDATASDADFRRAAEALAAGVHARIVAARAAAEWKRRTAAVRRGRGRPSFDEAERAAFIEGRVARALLDSEERVVAAIVARLRGPGAGAAPGGPPRGTPGA